ncbi:MAG: bifunctional pyr operon transcriptional regulator/uracil phosphoribosyltransferase PyrR [Clostridiales bacterium]|nr:bifunctional pyr operon transcriptional regulator/uracil phosphoribosyltransferase PyrR [Clostridiales bacterium]
MPCFVCKAFFIAFLKGESETEEKIIVDSKTMFRSLARLSHEIIESDPDADAVYLIGIKRRGVPLAAIIKENIERFSDIKVFLGKLDITLYRDDLTERYDKPRVNDSEIGFDVNGKDIILVDDVIFTGRTARAAMDAVISLGRPSRIRLAVMIDRGHRELPISANYVGKNIPTSRDEFIGVRVDEFDGANEVVLVKNG